VELTADSLLNNGGVMRGNNVIKYNAGESVTKVKIGDPIALTKSDPAASATPNSSR
jgi:adhesin HecA-like repeat protein